MSISILRKAIGKWRTAVVYLYAISFALPCNSQNPVLQFTASYVSSPTGVSSYTAFPASPGTFAACNTTAYTYTWCNGTANQLKLQSFTANSKTYIVSGVSGVQVKLRRVNNAVVSGIRDILYSETTAASASACVSPRTLNFRAPYNSDMASFLNNNVLNHGTDNIFANNGNGDGNNNNIERVDVVFPGGISSSQPADAGFVLCERGNNNGHDGFRIAAILSINSGNDPSAFGTVRTCLAGNGSGNGSWGHPALSAGNRLLPAYVLRKDPADAYLRVSSNVNQELGGVFFSLADLGVAANQVVYGYCLVGPDGIANPGSAQLLNLSNTSVYPTTTTEAQGGGLDLISVNTFFGTNEALASTNILSFSGLQEASDAILSWTLGDLATGTRITLQRSGDGRDFESVYSYLYTESYDPNFRDRPGYGPFYYRLSLTQPGGAEFFSKSIRLEFGNDPGSWTLYPAPAMPGEKIIADGLPDGTYHFSFYTSRMELIYRQTAIVSARKSRFTIPAPLSPGLYFIIPQRGLQSFPARKIIIRSN